MIASTSPPTEDDSIAAIATGVGGSISIIRLSGKDALHIADTIWRSKRPICDMPKRKLVLGEIVNSMGTVEDRCMAVFMPGPNSYTGESIIEFHCHGGVLVARSVLSLLLENGARNAEPGEFTKRAFLNGKMDLTQAEAVLDIIQSQSNMALHAANRQLAGILNRIINSLYESTKAILAEVEVRMDFSDEDLDWDATDRIAATIKSVLTELEQLLRHQKDGEILRNGIRLAIVGAANAGKSSLLNYILGRNRAIVTDIPGTTRDTLEELAQIRGIPVRLIDTAGIRNSDNPIELEGISRSLSSLADAHLVLWVIDSARDYEDQKLDTNLLSDKSVIGVANKIDLVPQITFEENVNFPLVKLSALTGEGIDELYDIIEKSVWHYPHTEEPEVAINARHGALLETAQRHLMDALERMNTDDFELIAVNLRSTLNVLGKITGKTIQPDILDNIFSKFCIGK